jgi:hypothetical protein
VQSIPGGGMVEAKGSQEVVGKPVYDPNPRFSVFVQPTRSKLIIDNFV